MPKSQLGAAQASPPQTTYVTIPTADDKITDFSPASLRQLAYLLCPFMEDVMEAGLWEFYQAQEIAALPACLLRPSARAPEPLSPPTTTTTTLHGCKAQPCTLHAPLNQFLIRKIYFEIIAECSTRLERLAAEPLESLPLRVKEHLLRMQSLNSLWMSEELYEQVYSVDGISYARIEGGCEACVVSAVGCDPDILRDLLAAIHGRKKQKTPPPGLVHMLQQFLECLEGGAALALEARRLGREIRKARKELQAERKMQRQWEKDRQKQAQAQAKAADIPAVDAPSARISSSRVGTVDWAVLEQFYGASSAVSPEPSSSVSSPGRPKPEYNEEESSLGAILSYYFRRSIAQRSPTPTRPVENSSSAYQEDVAYDEEKGFFYKASPDAVPISHRSPVRAFSPVSPSLYSQDEYIEARRESTHRKLVGEEPACSRPSALFTQPTNSTIGKGKQPVEALPKKALSFGRPLNPSRVTKYRSGQVPGKREASFQKSAAAVSSLSQWVQEQVLGKRGRSSSLKSPRPESWRRQDRAQHRDKFYENPRRPPTPPLNRGGWQPPVQRVTQMGDFMARTRRETDVG